jgi:hypothetical protein
LKVNCSYVALSWSTQEPCLSWFWLCNIASYGFRSIHILWMIFAPALAQAA